MSQNQKKQKKKEEKGRRKQKEVKKKFCKIANVIIIGEVHILKPLGSKLYMTTSSSENLTLVSRDLSKTQLKKKKSPASYGPTNQLQKRQRCAFPGQLPEPSHLPSLNWVVASRLLGHAPLNCPSKERFTQRESRVRIYISNHGVQNDLCQLMP